MKTQFFSRWLSGTLNAGNLPPDLQKAVDGLNQDAPGDPSLAEAEFAQAVQDVFLELRRWDEVYHNPYHNLVHGLTVTDRLHTMLRCSRTYPRSLWQALTLVGLCHDLAHPGATLRCDATKPLALPELGVEVSNEYVSGVLLDRILVKYGADADLRLVSFVGIQATTFGKPVTNVTGLERTIAIADIAPSKGLMEWVLEGNAVLEETALEKRPPDFAAWLQSRLGFLDFLKSRMTPLAWDIWGRNLQDIEHALQGVRDGLEPRAKLLLEAAVAPLLRTA